ncbi:hypothetical protein SEA_ELEPHANTOON_71 [Mycobacterium phage Elephantoon]|nr:hypothetical protein SEA_ELEPHANTOON_71 [Mycobacterium phage Elephantoon]
MHYRPTPPVKVRADRLTGEHVGKRLQFSFIFEPSKVGAIIFGDLDKVVHTDESTTVYLTRSKTGQGSAIFPLKPHHNVSVREAYKPQARW